MEQKTVAILFSGGLDSTMLLIMALNKKYRIILTYTKIKNNQSKTESELKAIGKILEWVEINYGKGAKDSISMRYLEVDIGFSLAWDGVNFVQFPIHMLSVIMNAGRAVNEIWMGYCMNDDIVPYVEDIKSVYNSYAPFFEGEKLPALVFPLLKYGKKGIVGDYPSDLLGLVWACEGGEQEYGKPCGTCVPCEKYKFLQRTDIRRLELSNLYKKPVEETEEVIEKKLVINSSNNHWD